MRNADAEASLRVLPGPACGLVPLLSCLTQQMQASGSRSNHFGMSRPEGRSPTRLLQTSRGFESSPALRRMVRS
jgi:hypothetical protein